MPYQGKRFVTDLNPPPAATPCRCIGCRVISDFNTLTPIVQCVLVPGEPVPAGRCSLCGDLTYPAPRN